MLFSQFALAFPAAYDSSQLTLKFAKRNLEIPNVLKVKSDCLLLMGELPVASFARALPSPLTHVLDSLLSGPQDTKENLLGSPHPPPPCSNHCFLDSTSVLDMGNSSCFSLGGGAGGRWMFKPRVKTSLASCMPAPFSSQERRWQRQREAARSGRHRLPSPQAKKSLLMNVENGPLLCDTSTKDSLAIKIAKPCSCNNYEPKKLRLRDGLKCWKQSACH